MSSRVALATALLLAVLTTPAHAGRLVATRHSFDTSCARTATPAPDDGCHGLRTLIAYARAAAPDPSKPLLILDGSARDVANGLQKVYAPNSPPSSQILDPGAPSTLQTPIDPTAYSAVVLASATAANFSALHARKTVLDDYLDNGGGVELFGATDTAASYYGLFPLPSPLPGGAAPFSLTGPGVGLLGLNDADTNCCAPDGAFSDVPAGSVLQVAERDATGKPVTLFGNGVDHNGVLVGEPTTLPHSCTSRRHFFIHVRKLPGVVYRQVQVFVNGTSVQTFPGRHFRSLVDLRGLPFGTFTVKIVVTGLGGLHYEGNRVYKTCRAGTLPSHKHPLR